MKSLVLLYLYPEKVIDFNIQIFICAAGLVPSQSLIVFKIYIVK